MGEKETPALILEAFEVSQTQARDDERKKVAEEAPTVAHRISDLVRLVAPSTEDIPRDWLSRMHTRIVFPYPYKGDFVGVTIHAPYYPPGPNLDYTISIEGLERTIQVVDFQTGRHEISYSSESGSVGFQQADLGKLNALLTGIEEGVADGSIKPDIKFPRLPHSAVLMGDADPRWVNLRNRPSGVPFGSR